MGVLVKKHKSVAYFLDYAIFGFWLLKNTAKFFSDTKKSRFTFKVSHYFCFLFRV